MLQNISYFYSTVGKHSLKSTQLIIFFPVAVLYEYKHIILNIFLFLEEVKFPILYNQFQLFHVLSVKVDGCLSHCCQEKRASQRH